MRAIRQLCSNRPHRLATSGTDELSKRQSDQEHKERQAGQRQRQCAALQTVHPRRKRDQESHKPKESSRPPVPSAVLECRLSHNDDYTTGRPYIESGMFGTQTLS
jgi:hypothetical protein